MVLKPKNLQQRWRIYALIVLLVDLVPKPPSLRDKQGLDQDIVHTSSVDMYHPI